MIRPALFFAAACIAGLAAGPLFAQGERSTPPREQKKEFDVDEFADAAREALDALTEKLLPMLEALGEKVGELSEYHPPEVLPNGDIIIRRKTPLEEEAPSPPPQEDEPVDL